MRRRTLRLGSTGEQVRQLQLLLKKKGCWPSNRRTSMFFGPITRRAVKKYQARAGLPADGVVGPKTWAKLLAVPKPKFPPPRKPTRRPYPRPTKASNQIIGFIADFEGFYAKPYNDPVGHCTIGYGTLLHLGNCTRQDYANWGSITKAEALKLLREEVDNKTPAVLKMVKVPLNQLELDALVSFAYNLGTGALAESTLLRKLNAEDRRGAAQEFMRWVNAGSPPRPLPGLVRRRRAERDLFIGKNSTYGTYG